VNVSIDSVNEDIEAKVAISLEEIPNRPDAAFGRRVFRTTIVEPIWVQKAQNWKLIPIQSRRVSLEI
jgi:hypothetical protein